MKILKSRRADYIESLYQQYARHIYTLSLRLLGKAPAAEKATITVFLKLAQFLHQGIGMENIQGLLLRITVDVALQQFGGSERVAATPSKLTRAQIQAEECFDHKSLNASLLEPCIQELPLRSRFAFVLHDIEGFPHEEIATMLKWTLRLAKTSLAEARLEIRQLLSNRDQAWAPTIS